MTLVDGRSAALPRCRRATAGASRTWTGPVTCGGAAQLTTDSARYRCLCGGDRSARSGRQPLQSQVRRGDEVVVVPSKPESGPRIPIGIQLHGGADPRDREADRLAKSSPMAAIRSRTGWPPTSRSSRITPAISSPPRISPSSASTASWRASSATCSFRIRRSSGRFLLTAKPIAKASMSLNESWS
jgi:hypothetical protein